MGHSIGAAYDPSAPAGHLPGFAREEMMQGAYFAAAADCFTIASHLRSSSAR